MFETFLYMSCGLTFLKHVLTFLYMSVLTFLKHVLIFLYMSGY